MYPFERFSEDAKKSLTLAQEEAERSNQSYIGTEHLLLGLLRVENGTANRALTQLGVDIESVREVISSVVGRNERTLVQHMIPTSRVKKVIEISFEEARRMGNRDVDTGHVLLGLAIEGEGIGAKVLQDLGATIEKLRPMLEREMGAPSRGRIAFPFPGRKQSPLGPSTGRADAPPVEPTDAGDLLRLLRSPAIARLLKARGIDTHKLTQQLAQPPTTVLELRSKLAVRSHALGTAVQVQDFELAANLRDEIRDLARKLAKAEQEWLDSLA